MAMSESKHYWNYRVMRHDDGDETYYEIHEVYYVDDLPDMYSESGISPSGDSKKELEVDINYMLKALTLPILTEDDFYKA